MTRPALTADQKKRILSLVEEQVPYSLVATTVGVAESTVYKVLQPKKWAELQAKWYKKNGTKKRFRQKFVNARIRSRRDSFEFDISWEQWQERAELFLGKPCLLLPHIDLTKNNASALRIDKAKGYTPDNLWFVSEEARRQGARLVSPILAQHLVDLLLIQGSHD